MAGTSTIFKPVDGNFPHSWLRCSAKEFLAPFCCTADFVPFCCCCMELRNITIFSLCYLIARMVGIYESFHMLWSKTSGSFLLNKSLNYKFKFIAIKRCYVVHGCVCTQDILLCCCCNPQESKKQRINETDQVFCKCDKKCVSNIILYSRKLSYLSPKTYSDLGNAKDCSRNHDLGYVPPLYLLSQKDFEAQLQSSFALNLALQNGFAIGSLLHT